MELQNELVSLPFFISEQEEWLGGWLSALGWSKSSLQEQSTSTLTQCSFNANHYIPRKSIVDHEMKCRCASHLGVNIDAVDWEELKAVNPDDSNFLYQNSSVESVQIGMPTKEAVKKLAVNFPEDKKVSKSRDSSVMYEQFSSLEDTRPSPQELYHQDLPHLISYIKSWKKIPSDYTQLDNSSINQGKVKGWLFKNLPVSHAHSAALGGEMTMVDSIMGCLTPSSAGQNRAKRINLTPNVVMNKLQPLLGIYARSLVLSLWQYFHISKLQKEHGMTDSFVSDIAPMPQVMVARLQAEGGGGGGEGGEGEEGDLTQSIAKLVTELKKPVDMSADSTSPLALPPDYMTNDFSTSERRILYDYIVEVTSRQALMKLDPDLYRDDMALLKAKLKADAKVEAAASKEGEGTEKEVDVKGKTYLQLLKEKRDYKRRRQKYRARNVHITRRTPTEIFRTIISNRMEELRASLRGSDDEVDESENKGKEFSEETEAEKKGVSGRERRRRSSHSRERESRPRKRERSLSWEEGEERGREVKRRRRRSKSRSQSVERRRRSRSRERQRRRSHSRRRHSKRSSRSRERSKDRSHKKHKKHRKKSRSRSLS